LPCRLTVEPYFCKYRTMVPASPRRNSKKDLGEVARFADRFAAMGTEARLRIMQLLLSAHPEGLVAGELQSELGIPGSTLSHHLDKLKNEGLVEVRRQGTYLRYTANTEALQEVLQFLYAECCTRNKAVKPQKIIRLCE
jgi:ArsR family transcriptional regulator